MTTLKDVAARAGVSLSTVSIVAKGQGSQRKISEATQDKVRSAMSELGYVPNAAARRLRGGNTHKSIVLFWADDFREAMLGRFLKGLHATIDKTQSILDISVVIYKSGKLSQVPTLQGVPDFNGIIIANANNDDLAYLADHKPLVPTVLYNRTLTRYASVAVDDHEIGQEAAQKVLRFIEERKKSDDTFEAAWKNPEAASAVAYLSAPYAFDGIKVREQAFVQELELAGIWAERLALSENSAQAGYAATKELLARNIRVVFTPSDTVALGILHACHEQGIDIPNRLGVIAVGNGLPEYAEYACPPLTRVEVPMETMAEKCLTTLLEQLENMDSANNPQQTVLHPQLIGRASL